jgi:hypothetical protein
MWRQVGAAGSAPKERGSNLQVRPNIVVWLAYRSTHGLSCFKHELAVMNGKSWMGKLTFLRASVPAVFLLVRSEPKMENLAPVFNIAPPVEMMT